MATYRLWLTVKDSNGNIKEVDGGTVNIDLTELTDDEINQIEEALPLERYITKTELDTELDKYATDQEVTDTVVDSIQNNEAIRYGDFEFFDENVEGGN
jgi:hypothetical protein